MKKIFKILGIIAGSVCAREIVSGATIGNYLYNFVLNPLSDKSSLLAAPKKKGASGVSALHLKDWFKITALDNYIYSFDNLKLHSYVVYNEKPTHKWVIMCHGYNGNGLRESALAPHFYKMGFNILAPDARGHGKSAGKYIGMGWNDRKDIISWINKILKDDEKAEIVLYGVSMGGASVIMASGENLPQNVRAVIDDCGYSSAWDELGYQLRTNLRFPSFPTLNWMSCITKLKAGYSLKDANAVKQVQKSKIPTLFIHGSEDTFVPPYMTDKLYGAAKCPKQKLIIKGAKHAESAAVDPKTYWKTINSFLKEHKVL